MKDRTQGFKSMSQPPPEPGNPDSRVPHTQKSNLLVFSGTWKSGFPGSANPDSRVGCCNFTLTGIDRNPEIRISGFCKSKKPGLPLILGSHWILIDRIAKLRPLMHPRGPWTIHRPMQKQVSPIWKDASFVSRTRFSDL